MQTFLATADNHQCLSHLGEAGEDTWLSTQTHKMN